MKDWGKTDPRENNVLFNQNKEIHYTISADYDERDWKWDNDCCRKYNEYMGKCFVVLFVAKWRSGFVGLSANHLDNGIAGTSQNNLLYSRDNKNIYVFQIISGIFKASWTFWIFCCFGIGTYVCKYVCK